MPQLTSSCYHPPLWLCSGHLQTIYPTLRRRVAGVAYRRERVELADGDFVDVDWCRGGARRAALVCHGLESNSRSHYVLGLVRALVRRGWDAAALNFRGCSGEPNRLLRSYHSGDTGDVAVVLQRMANVGYRDLALVGFSLGGNVVLKYLGERFAEMPKTLRTAAAVSVPCDLAASARRLARWSNRLYMRRFLRKLDEKMAAKAARFPDQVRLADFVGITTFQEFDDRYTAPAHGFTDAADYYAAALPRRSCPPSGCRRWCSTRWTIRFSPQAAIRRPPPKPIHAYFWRPSVGRPCGLYPPGGESITKKPGLQIFSLLGCSRRCRCAVVCLHSARRRSLRETDHRPDAVIRHLQGEGVAHRQFPAAGGRIGRSGGLKRSVHAPADR